ncbi:MAG: S-layer homology domain-containing protein, partial [Oscillospiraceae bacterium]|nr:S-layer homology domain-containing protein [Oscillospiraceae bacterium]
TTASNSNGSLISGATSASFPIPTTLKTTTYYYVVVSAALEGATIAPVTSNVVTVTVTPKVIDIQAIPGVTAPVPGETPVSAIGESTQYTGTVSWSANDEALGAEDTFDYNTAYTATITLTAKTGYTLTGVSADFFEVSASGATAKNNADSGVVTAVFSATEPYVNAATPSIGTDLSTGEVEYKQGDTTAALTVVASVTDDGELSYQWYSNTSDSNNGGTSLGETNGAQTASYTPPTAVVGTTYYYVVVTNTNTGVNGSTTATVTSAAAQITVTPKSSDAALGSLAVDGYTLSPTFDASTYAYTVSVPNAATSVTVTAAANDDDAASVVVTGGTSLSVGDNTVTVTVTAEDGSTQTYTITVKRASATVIGGGGSGSSGVGSGSSGVGSGSSGSGSGSSGVTKEEPETIDIEEEKTPYAEAPVKPFLFIDVIQGTDWFYDDVYYVFQKDLMNGTTDTEFSPSAAITRGMLVTILGRHFGIDASGYESGTFTDVDGTKYYAPYIAWAAERGIVNGIGEGKFAPDAPVTRQEAATFLARYAEFLGLAPSDAGEVSFSDASEIGDWALDGVDWAAKRGLIQGRPGNIFDPKKDITRGEIAAILHRFLLLLD